MNAKIAGLIGFAAGVLLMKYAEEHERKLGVGKSTITVDFEGQISDIHLNGSHRTSKNFIKKVLPEEITVAKKLWEQNKEKYPDGLTMFINR